MLGALFSFLGGSIFRMLWGEVSAALTKWQDHSFEVQRMKLQGELDAAQHQRNQDAIRLQAELGIKTIQVQAEAAVSQLEAQGWLESVKATTIQTGIAFVDAWNATIRPGVATWAVVMITLSEFKALALSAAALEVCSAALGIYLADRSMLKRGK